MSHLVTAYHQRALGSQEMTLVSVAQWLKSPQNQTFLNLPSTFLKLKVLCRGSLGCGRFNFEGREGDLFGNS